MRLAPWAVVLLIVCSILEPQAQTCFIEYDASVDVGSILGATTAISKTHDDTWTLPQQTRKIIVTHGRYYSKLEKS